MQSLPELSSALRSVSFLLALVMLPIAVHSAASSVTSIDGAKAFRQATEARCGAITSATMPDGKACNSYVRGTERGTRSSPAKGPDSSR